ncbi:hypothetical protein ACFVY4_27050 [Streptomyces sp. NPDC058299]|uniref:hypothetical protein n=1 Tax=Streptomyces sp. NPDC058299 TaxID=3346435 RepID=UPI0036E1EC8B
MTPPTGARPALPLRQARIGDDWYDLEHAAKAVGNDRSTQIRQLIAWYLRQPGVELPERPPVKAWQAAAQAAAKERAKAGVWSVTEEGHTKQSKFRVSDDDWEALAQAARTMGLERAEVVRQLIAWFLRRRRALLPERPPLEAWFDTSASYDPQELTAGLQQHAREGTEAVALGLLTEHGHWLERIAVHHPQFVVTGQDAVMRLDWAALAKAYGRGDLAATPAQDAVLRIALSIQVPDAGVSLGSVLPALDRATTAAVLRAIAAAAGHPDAAPPT